VNSSAKLAAFDNAFNSFTSAHPDFHVLELPNDVVVFDTHLNPGNVGHANVAIWTFVDGSQVTLVGVAPHVTPLGYIGIGRPGAGWVLSSPGRSILSPGICDSDSRPDR
jgi:hypothetical protein